MMQVNKRKLSLRITHHMKFKVDNSRKLMRTSRMRNNLMLLLMNLGNTTKEMQSSRRREKPKYIDSKFITNDLIKLIS